MLLPIMHARISDPIHLTFSDPTDHSTFLTRHDNMLCHALINIFQVFQRGWPSTSHNRTPLRESAHSVERSWRKGNLLANTFLSTFSLEFMGYVTFHPSLTHERCLGYTIRGLFFVLLLFGCGMVSMKSLVYESTKNIFFTVLTALFAGKSQVSSFFLTDMTRFYLLWHLQR